jgi:hypothetical protein
MMTAPAPRNFAARWLAPLAALAMLGGCVATPMADVTRFHLGQPVPAASISIVPIKAMEHILEYRSYAEAVAPEFTRIGFTPVPNDGLSTYIGVLKVEQTSREGEISRSPITVGIGGGSFGGGGGIGGGISLPIGGGSGNIIRTNFLGLEIRRRSDNSIVWEGRAEQSVSGSDKLASLASAVPVLARVLLADFPGTSGQTVRVKAQ